jgi:NADPH:quinone reductase-like Zn-dependent oxidoreductase
MNLALQHATQPSIAYLQNFEQPGRRLKVAVGMLGALNSLYWKDEDQLPLAPGEIEIKIAFTGMNFKDVVIAMGQVPSPYLGVECSGTVYRTAPDVSALKAGDRVCAMSLGAYGTFARCPATSATIVPAAMSLKMAASIPVVYSTAYYGLTELARLEDGEKVLIHAASGGVGQAAIQLAQSIGAEIYATVGSAEKKAMIMDTYDIPESHIFYSRDASFGPAIREVTQGKGVDVVINSLAGDLLRETWECLAPFGRFIEIGKRDIVSNTRLEMSKFDYNCTFSSVDMTLVAAQRPKLMERVLNAVLGMMIQGEISPIGPITEVGIADVETALRKLQSGKTTGKVVVNHLLGEQVKVRELSLRDLKRKLTRFPQATHPRPPLNLLDEEATYIIIGGTGGLGRSIAKMMCRRGARQIVLLSRSGRMTPDLERLTQESASIDASIHIKQCDVSDASSVSKLITQMRKSLPPVKGIIHAAMVLKVSFHVLNIVTWMI